MNSKVSVIIPVKNRLPELKRAILSVLDQTHQQIEVLVVDDGSEGDTAALVKSFNDHRIRWVKNQGPDFNANVCRNIGLNEATGEFVAMLDSDDAWLPEHLEIRLEEFSSRNVDGLFGSYYIDNGKNRKPVVSRQVMTTESMADYTFSGGAVQTSSHFYSTASAKEILWDEKLLRHQDYDFVIRFAEKYRFEPCEALTVVVHWQEGVPRAKHVPSMIQFIRKHNTRFNAEVLKKYLLSRFSEFWNAGEKESAEAFKKEALRLRHVINLTDYHQLNPATSVSGKISVRLKFICFKYLKLS